MTTETELTSGTYSSSGDKTVIYWRAPDKDGTGDVVWENRVDETGREVGRYKKKDKDGNEVRLYPAPEGFENRPSFDHTDNYVKVGYNGEVARNPQGEALGIKPGQALVMHTDGTVEYLNDEYERYTFINAHEQISSDDTVPEGDVPNDPPVKATPATVAKPK